jgi:hypothetical protein
MAGRARTISPPRHDTRKENVKASAKMPLNCLWVMRTLDVAVLVGVLPLGGDLSEDSA